jgi:hypothetical protein
MMAFTGNILNAQNNVKWLCDPIKLENGFRLEAKLCVRDNIIFFKTVKHKTIGIAGVSLNTNNVVFNEELKVPESKSDVYPIRLMGLNGKFLLLAEVFIKDKVSLKAYSINNKGRITAPGIEIASYEKENYAKSRKKSFSISSYPSNLPNIYISADSTKLAVLQKSEFKKGEEQTYLITVLNGEDLSVMSHWNAPIPFRNVTIRNTTLTNDGNILILSYVTETDSEILKKYNLTGSCYCLLDYNIKDKTINAYPYSIEGHTFSSSLILNNKKANCINIGILLSEEDYYAPFGGLYLEFDNNKKEFTKHIYCKLDPIKISGLSRDAERKAYVEDYYQLATCYYDDSDQSVVFVLKWINSTFWEKVRRRKRFHRYDDIVFKADSIGNLLWAIADTKTATYDDKDLLESLYSFENGELNIIYNDRLSNIKQSDDNKLKTYTGNSDGVITHTHISSNGKLTKNVIEDPNPKDVFLVSPTNSIMYNDNLIVIGRSANNKYFKIGRFEKKK